MWIILTHSIEPIDLILGFFVIHTSQFITRALFNQEQNTRIFTFSSFILYVFSLVYSIIISGFKSLYYIIFRKTDVSIINIETKLTNPLSIFMLSISITLTPGTITILNRNQTLTVLSMFPLPEDEEEASKEIKGNFEELLLKRELQDAEVSNEF
jgi:multicomponent Na+:H+ antiporter subunit E